MFVIVPGCTDLQEDILDETSGVGLSEKQKADGAIAPVYAPLPNIYLHTAYFALQEITTDEAILPFRGGKDWDDSGIYVRLHQHTTISTDANINDTWTRLNDALARALIAINELPNNQSEVAKTYLAEARAMKAFYSMLTLDLYGVVFAKNNLGEVSKVLRGEEAVNYIRQELEAAEPDLSTSVGPGRITKAAAWGLLARLHLNAAVYSNRYADQFNFSTDDMDKVISYCDKIIASGQYQLSPDYFAIFGNDNHTNKEILFAVDQRPDLNGHNRLAYFSLSGDQFPLPQYPSANGTDGAAITPDFYDTWTAAYGETDPADADPRFYQENLSIYSNANDTCVAAANFKINRGILRGQQYGLLRVNGAFLKCSDGRMKVGKLYSVTRSLPNLAVDFTKEINYSVDGRAYNTGYRVEKYEFSRVSDSGRNKGEADIVILRLADVYLMRAEAKLRKGLATDALQDVNTVRAARTLTTPAPALTSLNLDVLFRERGFEFYWEMLRRTDMIRFGKYEGTWTEKTNSDKQKRIFPIPQKAIDAASSTPGYLVQNPGY